jgi:hypothetical protein
MMRKNGGESLFLKVMTQKKIPGLMSRHHLNQNRKKRPHYTSHLPVTQMTKGKTINKRITEDFAFRNGPRRDGIIRKKDGSLLIIDDLPYPETLQPIRERPKEEGELPERDSTPPRWSPLLIRIQRRELKMKYKARTKIRAKLMKAIRKYVPIKESTQYVFTKRNTQASNPNQKWNKTSATTNKLRTLLSLFPNRLTVSKL